jgi:hypothetical protein
MALTPPAAPRGLRLRPVDLALLAYLAAISVVALVRLDRFPACRWVLLANALTALLIWLLARPGLGVVGRALREIYPILLLVALYSAIDLLNGGGAVPVHDALVQQWEEALFGFQPARDWWRTAPSAFWSTVFHGAYFAYYLIIPLPVGWFAWKGDLPALRRTVLYVTVTFVACYLAFVFFPVAGPYYEFARPTGAFVQNPMARLVYDVLSSGSAYGAAFPSSHVAATVTATAAAMMGSRRLGWLLVVPTALLTVGVVYCQMHYAVDAIAGVMVAGVVVGMGRALKDWGWLSR